MPESAPPQAHALDDFIPGTPHTGWYDTLDPSYRMRSGFECYHFFVVGRVFAMLYSETASETSSIDPNDDAYTVVRLGGRAYTNIRRFVVVEVRKGFVYAYAIGTYGRRGVNKPGCDPADHAIVYFTGTNPSTCYLPGEVDHGMDKDPIEVSPAEPDLELRRESRIRLDKRYPIEKNVKVKDIGRVRPDHLTTLLSY